MKNEEMNYREFVELVSRELGSRLPKKLRGASVTPKQVDKLRGESYYGIEVRPEGSDIGTTIDLSQAYSRMLSGVPMDKVLSSIAAYVLESLREGKRINTDDFSNYEAMKKYLMIQLVPTAGNEEMLAGIPHTEREDLSIVYCFVFNSGLASALIPNTALDGYGITAQQLHEDAMANAPKNFPVSILAMDEAIAGITGNKPEGKTALHIAACNGGRYGAGCIFYPGFMEMAAEKMGGSFFILPSSVHEVILAPDNGNIPLWALENMVREVNASCVMPEERLSDTVYHYDADKRVFGKAKTQLAVVKQNRSSHD